MWTVFAVGYPDCPVAVDVVADSPAEAVRHIVGEWVPVEGDGIHEVLFMVYGATVSTIMATVTVVNDVVTAVA